MRARLHGRRLALGLAAGAVLAVVGGFSLVRVVSAASAGERGRSALSRAEANLSARELAAARENLTAAHLAFSETRAEIDRLGPLAGLARRLPLVGTQMKAVDTFASAGSELAQAAQRLVDAADTIVNPPDQQLPVSAALDALRRTQQSLGPAVTAINHASDEVARLRGRFLVGPLARARDDLTTRLPRIQARATSAEQGLSALMAFAGDSGPKRYLFLSQNPDEVRPTGGFIGTYGVLTAEGGHMRLERYDAIEKWPGNRQAEVPPGEVGSPFRFSNPPQRRTLANVNSGPDWPAAAQLAANLWREGGEEPVDGVISFTPGFLGRILSVVGPVPVPSYDETVTAENLNERLDFHTHQAEPPQGSDRKDFVAVLAETVMGRLLEAPASQWEPLGRVMGQAFEERQAMAWSNDPAVAATLAERGWDGAFPPHDGDFFYSAEFQYAAKNGRAIRRVYDHHVALGADGAGRVTTTVTITNPAPFDLPYNPSTLAYITIYGPEGGVVDEAASEGYGFKEPTLAGHPAMGWFKAAAPGGGQTTLKVVWDVPRLVEQAGGGSWQYSLRWMHLPDHTGDVVNLSFSLPPTWQWKDGAPPAQFSLDREMVGSWLLTSGS